MMFDRLDDATVSMILAMFFGAIIGMERQARGRMAGVRTNALVALGAASFVLFSTLFVDASPTRVAAQIVSGIGFLGAGLIFRDGYSVHGLNTAATLWCSAAVGMMCGAGAYPLAVALTVIVMFVNLALRPIVHWVDHRFMSGEDPAGTANLRITCEPEAETAIRAITVKRLDEHKLALSCLESRTQRDGMAELVFTLALPASASPAVDRVVAALAAEPGLLGVGWSAHQDD